MKQIKRSEFLETAIGGGVPDEQAKSSIPPANKFANINFIYSFSGNATIKIYSSEGKLFETAQTEIKKGQNSAMLDVSKYPNGVYIILFNTSTEQYSTKLIVSHH